MTALAAIIYQECADERRIISFASRILKDVETKYLAVELECLAILWAIQKFSQYLFGAKFILKIDCKSNIYYLSSPNRSRKVQRWALELQEYDFDIQHVPGTTNLEADCLSRLSCPMNEIPDVYHDEQLKLALKTGELPSDREEKKRVEKRMGKYEMQNGRLV